MAQSAKHNLSGNIGDGRLGRGLDRQYRRLSRPS
jgi:hypothetical protein